MGTSILKVLPPNTKLKHYVERIMKLYRDLPPLWQSEDETEREAGLSILIMEERRPWKLPHEFVRDRVILPTIRETHGAELADAVERCPAFLDLHTALMRDAHYRSASPRERATPKPKIAGLVRGVVLSFYIQNLDPTVSNNANYLRTAKALGIDRFSVKRIVEHSLNWNAETKTFSTRKGVIEAIARITQMLRRIDVQDKSLVQNSGSRSAIASNKGS